MSNDVPLLTVEMAALLRGHDPAHIAGCVEALEAIATGRAVVIPRRTEAEWRAEFFSAWNAGHVQPSQQDGWLAALRHVGAIRPDEKENGT